MTNESLVWQVRAFVYAHFADTTHPPSVEETAKHFNIGLEEAGALYKELHNCHANGQCLWFEEERVAIV